MNYTSIDSFSGAGGLLLGLQIAGFESILSFDNDPHSIATQNSNPKYFKHKALVKDIYKFSDEEILNLTGLERGELFLFAGGPPCQGFSIQRVGSDTDVRNDLVFKYFDLVEGLYPKFFLMENVPGIIGRRGKTIVDLALERASEFGYRISTQIVNAQDFGVPQRRRRVIIVGTRQDVSDEAFKLTNGPGRITTVRQAIGYLPAPPQGGEEHPEIRHHRRDQLSPLNIKRIAALKPGQGRDHLPQELLAECHKLDSSKIGHRNVYGRMAWDDVAPTITARFDSFTRGMFGHPEQNRSITLREGALLQTFPADFNFSGNKVDVARQIGNAVPVKLAEELGNQIVKFYVGSKKAVLV